MKLRIEANPDCDWCEGRGIYTTARVDSIYQKSVEISIHICKCVTSHIIGKPPKKFLESIVAAESAESKEKA